MNNISLHCLLYLDRIEGWLGAISSIWLLWLLLLTIRWENWCKLTGLIGEELGIEGSRQLWIPVEQQLGRLQHQLR